MTENPYQSPDANVDTNPNSGPDPERRPIRGIFISFLIDVGGTFVGIAIMAIVYVGFMAYSGKTKMEIDHILSTSDPTATFNLLTALWGVMMSYIGGYFCVKISRARDFTYPTVLGVLVFIFGVATSWQALDAAEIMLWSTLSFGATMFGAQRALAH